VDQPGALRLAGGAGAGLSGEGLHHLPRELPDGSLSAICYVDRTSFDPGEDLAAYLIQRGWALALPNAPFEYHALEKIASTRELGVWGFPVDSFSDRVFPEGTGKW
jgi:hypothetical protein